MYIQGCEFRFEGLNITVAYFSDNPDAEFDNKVPHWLGDDSPFDDTFIDLESFTFRKGGGVLLVAASNLTGIEMELVNQLVYLSNEDRIKLLICAERKRYRAPQFDAVIRSTYDLVDSLYDLAFSFLTGSNTGDGDSDISGLSALIKQSRKGVLVNYWDERKNKNLITPHDLINEWPFPIEKYKKVAGIHTWLNPANYRWSDKTSERFVRFCTDEIGCKQVQVSSCGHYEPEASRKPLPDVIQLLMLN